FLGTLLAPPPQPAWRDACGGGNTRSGSCRRRQQRRRVVARRGRRCPVRKEKARVGRRAARGAGAQRGGVRRRASEGQNRLVVVEFAASHSVNSKRIYPCMVDLSRTCGDVDFLLVMGDESDATEAVQSGRASPRCRTSPSKGTEKVHERKASAPTSSPATCYYGDNHAGVVRLHSQADVEALMAENSGEAGSCWCWTSGSSTAGLRQVYPTVVKLSRSMADTTVFARMNGDENDACMDFLKDMEVVEVPTFLFIRDNKIVGRYVGSGKGELIGEILRYQGVRSNSPPTPPPPPPPVLGLPVPRRSSGRPSVAALPSPLVRRTFSRDPSCAAGRSCSATPTGADWGAEIGMAWSANLETMELEILGMNFGCVLSALADAKIPEKQCLLPLVSKLLGYCIVAASTTVKLPQILKHRSVRGLSVASFELELIGYTIALTYCIHKGLPFSAYGELAFLLIQAPTVLAGKIDPGLLKSFMLHSMPSSSVLECINMEKFHSRPLFSNKSTGELSFLTSFMNFAGSLVRVFTSIQEKTPLSGIL
ncbi:hypothetical protein ZWY2020_024613, partial [Hordeum vulgare]